MLWYLTHGFDLKFELRPGSKTKPSAKAKPKTKAKLETVAPL